MPIASHSEAQALAQAHALESRALNKPRSQWAATKHTASRRSLAALLARGGVDTIDTAAMATSTLRCRLECNSKSSL